MRGSPSSSGVPIDEGPYDLAGHFHRRGTYFADGQILESTRVMGPGAAGRERRVIYQCLFARRRRDDRSIDAVIDKAERIAAEMVAMRRARFLKITGVAKEFDQAVTDRARQLAGLKGYVTNLPVDTMDGRSVIGANHDLWNIETSFWMTKSDLKVRPVFHQIKDAIEAHLTVVFTALDISRNLQDAIGITIKRRVRTLRTIPSAAIELNSRRLTLPHQITASAQGILDALEGH